MSPIVGYMIDRYGPKPMMFTAALLAGIGYILFSHVNSYTTLLIVYLGVISVAFTAGFVHAPTVVANNWFIRLRARAMTVVSAAVPVGGALITSPAPSIMACSMSCPLALSLRRPDAIGIVNTRQRAHFFLDTHLDDHFHFGRRVFRAVISGQHSSVFGNHSYWQAVVSFVVDPAPSRVGQAWQSQNFKILTDCAGFCETAGAALITLAS